MKCKCCGKKPSEIREYVIYSADEEITPEEFVEQNEGTYNSKTGLFYCTDCYIKLGMPSGIA